MLLINCEINLMVTWSANCVICEADIAIFFAMTDSKLHVPVVTLLTQDNMKLLEQLRSGFKRAIKQEAIKSINSQKICILIT